MKLFEKHHCFNCGQSVDLLAREYGQKPDRKYLCENCCDKLHISGFEDYRSDISEFVTDFETSKAYSEYFNRIVSNRNNYVFDESPVERLTCELGRLIMNKNFISVGGYRDLLIDTSDVIAVALERNEKYSGLFREGICVSIFTNNPLVPHVSGFVTGVVRFFSFSMKAKECREDINDWFVENCPNLRYPVTSPSKLKKAIKQDSNYTGGYSKQKICSVLTDASINSGMFKAKKIIKAEEYMPYKINMDMGYAIIDPKKRKYIFPDRKSA